MSDPTRGPAGGQIYRDAIHEAQRVGDRAVGTDHLALALLVDPGSRTARALGVDLAAARAAAARLDRQALVAAGLGIDLDAPPIEGRSRARLRLTPQARIVLTSLRQDPGAPRLSLEERLLLSLLTPRRPDRATALLDALAIDRTAVRTRLASVDA